MNTPSLTSVPRDFERLPGHAPHGRDGPAWVWALAVLVFAACTFGLGLDRLPLKGEESRRGRFASEMIASGDWVVTTQQGEPFVDRPPLQYWAVSAAYALTGEESVRSLRLSAAVATVLASLLVFWYTAHFTGPMLGAFAAAAFATMGLMLDIGRKGEAESIFTLLLGGSLLVWHGGLIRGWPVWAFWCAGYALAALGTLTKGTQAPVAFIGATVLWLSLERRWRILLSPGHALGALLYAALVGVWLIPLAQRLGWDGLRNAFVEPGRERFDAPWWQYLRHWALFPGETLIIMLPWSPLLLGYRFLRRRDPDDPVRSAACFLLLAMGVLLVPLWIAPWARGRYFLPAFPAAAALLGLIIAHALSGRTPQHEQLLRLFARVLAVCLLVVSVGLVLSPWTRASVGESLGAVLADPRAPVILTALVIGAAGAAVLWAARPSATPGSSRRRMAAALCGVAVCFSLGYQTLVVRGLAAPAFDTPGAVRAAKASLPQGAHLVSLGPIHHRFAFFWGDPIPIVAPDAVSRIGPGEYFCIDTRPGEAVAVPFDWEGIASVEMHVYRRDDERAVVIGRRAAVTRAEGQR